MDIASNNNIFSQMDFGPLTEFLEQDDITDISYSNGGQVWLKTLSKGVYQVERPEINNPFMEKLAFQCSNVMGKTFNMAHPFLDAESAELRMNFVHESIATNGIACLIRKTPAKIRLNKEKLIDEQYITVQLHDFLMKCIEGHCNIIVAGETGSGKTELVKYLASNIKENEKIITIEDTLELHLDRIFPHRDIVAMKTNNIASYTDVLVTCMRQNPIWILLSEVRSGEAVLAVRNSISSGHHILSTIHADKASSIPMRMYSLLESSQDIEQFLGSIHRYVQIGIYVKGYFSKALNRFQREIIEVCEFYVDEDNKPMTNILYQKSLDGKVTLHNPTQVLLNYLSIGNVFLPEDTFGLGESGEGTDTTSGASTKTLNLDVDDPFKMNEEEQNSMATNRSSVDTPIANVEVPTPSSLGESGSPVMQEPTNSDGITYTKIISATPDNVTSSVPQNEITQAQQSGLSQTVSTQVTPIQTMTPQIEIPRTIDNTITNNVSEFL